MSLSIRAQIVLSVSTITIAVAIALGASVIGLFETRAVAFAHRAAIDDAHVVANLIERSMALFGIPLEDGAGILSRERLLYGFTRGPGDTRVQLIDRRGRVIFDTLRQHVGEDLSRERDVAAALDGTIDEHADASDTTVVASVPVRSRGLVVGAARVSKSTFGMTELASAAAPQVSLIAVLLAIAAALIGWFLGARVAKPVERLTDAAAAIAAGERQARLPVPRGHEVRALTAAFEAMRDELEERHAIEALAADLSHELKNPVASIRASAEVLEDALREPDLDNAARFVSRIREANDRLESILTDLLSLSRIEAGPIRAVPIDLADVVRRSVEAVRSRAERAGVTIELAAAPCASLGDAAWLERAVTNLLSNALEHTPERSRIDVTLGRSSDADEIVVRDEGSGVEPAIRERIFDRFVSRRAGGTGLGLAIVRAVAESHGGRAELRESETGSVFALVLPRQ